MSESTTGASPVLLLESYLSGTPVLTASDNVSTATTAATVQCTVDSTSGSAPITGVTAVSVNGSPSVTFTNNSGVWSATFPASYDDAYSWNIEVSISLPETREAPSQLIVLDPKLIIRRTT